jgi:hypothetical protein
MMITTNTTHKMPAPTRTLVGLTSMAMELSVIRFITRSPLLFPQLFPRRTLIPPLKVSKMIKGVSKAAQPYTEKSIEPREKWVDLL